MIQNTAVKVGIAIAVLNAIHTTAAAPAAQGANSAPGKFTTVTVSDPMFNMPAYTVQIPADWRFEGAVIRAACGDANLVYRAESPDGLMGVQSMPKVQWTYAENAQARQLGNQACNFHAPVSALKQAPEIAAATRPHPEIESVEPWTVPGMAEAYAKSNQMFENNARAYGQPPSAATHLTGDAARVRMRYSYQGHAEEELMTVVVTVSDTPVSIMGTGARGIIQPGMARAQRTETFVSAQRAPAGKLDAAMPLLKQIKIAMVPEYDQAVLAFMNQQFQRLQAMSNASFQNTLRQGQDSFQKLMAQHQAYMQWQTQSYAKERQQFAADMQRKDANNKNFVDYVSDQTYYMNPETGATVTVKNVPGSNGVVTPSVNGGWVQLQPISH